MRTIGIRAAPTEVTFAIFDTSENALVNVEKIKIPKALAWPDALKYVRNNVLDILREYSVERGGLRVTESSAQQRNIQRIELEGVMQEAFASSSLTGITAERFPVFRVVPDFQELISNYSSTEKRTSSK